MHKDLKGLQGIIDQALLEEMDKAFKITHIHSRIVKLDYMRVKREWEIARLNYLISREMEVLNEMEALKNG